MSQLACNAVREWVDEINSDMPFKMLKAAQVIQFDNAGGALDDDKKREAFRAALRTSDGKPDKTPIKLMAMYQLHKDDFSPAYLMVLQREAWHLKSLEQEPDTLETIEIDDPHYSVDQSYWIVTFFSNNILTMRETPELWHIPSSLDALCNKAPVEVVSP